MIRNCDDLIDVMITDHPDLFTATIILVLGLCMFTGIVLTEGA